MLGTAAFTLGVGIVFDGIPPAAVDPMPVAAPAPAAVAEEDDVNGMNIAGSCSSIWCREDIGGWGGTGAVGVCS